MNLSLFSSPLSPKKKFLLKYSFASIFFRRLHHLACEIMFPGPGIQPAPPAVEAWSLNHWTSVVLMVLVLPDMVSWIDPTVPLGDCIGDILILL